MRQLFINEYIDDKGRAHYDEPVTSKLEALEEIRAKDQTKELLWDKAYCFDWKYQGTLEIWTNTTVYHNLKELETA